MMVVPRAESPEEGECLSDDYGDSSVSNLKQPPYVDVDVDIPAHDKKRSSSSSTTPTNAETVVAATITGKIKFDLVPQNKNKAKAKTIKNKITSTNHGSSTITSTKGDLKASTTATSTFMSQQISIPSCNNDAVASTGSGDHTNECKSSSKSGSTEQPTHVVAVTTVEQALAAASAVDDNVESSASLSGSPFKKSVEINTTAATSSLHPSSSKRQKPNDDNDNDAAIIGGESGATDMLLVVNVDEEEDNDQQVLPPWPAVRAVDDIDHVSETRLFVDDVVLGGNSSDDGSSMDIESSDADGGDDDDNVDNEPSNHSVFDNGKEDAIPSTVPTTVVVEEEKVMGEIKDISALHQPLIIQGISKTGPLNLVRIVNKKPRKRLNTMALTQPRNGIVRATTKLADTTNTGDISVAGDSIRGKIHGGSVQGGMKPLRPVGDNQAEVNQQNKSEQLNIKIARMKERIQAAKEKEKKKASPGTNVGSDDLVANKEEMLKAAQTKRALLLKKQELLKKQQANQQATASSLTTTKKNLVAEKAVAAIQSKQTLTTASVEIESHNASCLPVEKNESVIAKVVPMQELVEKKRALLIERKAKIAESRKFIVDTAKALKEQREICDRGRKRVLDLEKQRDSLERLLVQASQKLVNARKRVAEANAARPRGSERRANDFF